MFNEDGSLAAELDAAHTIDQWPHTIQFKNPSADPAIYIDIDAIMIE